MSGIIKYVLDHKVWLLFMPVVVGTAGVALCFQHYYVLIIWFPEQSPTRYFLQTSNILLYLMGVISLLQSNHIKNTVPPSQPHHAQNYNSAATTPSTPTATPRQIKLQLQTSKNFALSYMRLRCQNCMCSGIKDHHCMYIDNYLGHYNFKAFLLANGYTALFNLQFVAVTTYIYFLMIESKLNKFTENQTTILLYLTIFCLMFMLSTLGLTITNLVMISKNITRMDLLKGQFKFSDTDGSHPNPFDLGIITNFNTLFKDQSWQWWFPTQIVVDSDGTAYPMLPHITDQDKKSLSANLQEMLRTPIERSIPNTIEQLWQQQCDNYNDVIFFFMGKQYRIKKPSSLKHKVNDKADKYNVIAIENTIKPVNHDELIEDLFEEYTVNIITE